MTWARARDDIRAVVLVGSYARGTAREGSDIDLVLLVDAPQIFRADTAWMEAIAWASTAGDLQWRDEDYGVVWSRRILLGSGPELEISFAPLAWAAIAPLDAGARRVVSDGCRVLYDPDLCLERLVQAAENSTSDKRPVSVVEGRGAICREVLEALPEWFGVPASVETFVSEADRLPMLACFEPAGDVAGFVSIKLHTAVAAEVYVMGVKRTWHRQGIGRSLIEAAAQLSASQGARFLTVKTLSPSNPDPSYAATRLFYEAVGFLPIEEFPLLWGADNPCLLMLRPLQGPQTYVSSGCR